MFHKKEVIFFKKSQARVKKTKTQMESERTKITHILILLSVGVFSCRESLSLERGEKKQQHRYWFWLLPNLPSCYLQLFFPNHTSKTREMTVSWLEGRQSGQLGEFFLERLGTVIKKKKKKILYSKSFGILIMRPQLISTMMCLFHCTSSAYLVI